MLKRNMDLGPKPKPHQPKAFQIAPGGNQLHPRCIYFFSRMWPISFLLAFCLSDFLCGITTSSHLSLHPPTGRTKPAKPCRCPIFLVPIIILKSNLKRSLLLKCCKKNCLIVFSDSEAGGLEYTVLLEYTVEEDRFYLVCNHC